MLPDQPLWAETADVAECLSHLGRRPLKLVADAVVREYGETPWPGGRWLEKQLLDWPPDTFQFSIADHHARQDFHRHAGVLEIYASHSPIELTYRDKEGRPARAAVAGGIVIVPPGVAHQVTLGGMTFVFQVALGGGGVHEDKEILEGP